MKARSAFTLIEILVVLAVISICAVLMMSAIARGKVGVNKLQCASNLRAIGTAMNFYSADHAGDFPGSAHTDEEDSWIYTLAPYLQQLD